MNLLGYYEQSEVWIPDPILQMKQETLRRNHVKKEHRPHKNFDTMLSFDERHASKKLHKTFVHESYINDFLDGAQSRQSKKTSFHRSFQSMNAVDDDEEDDMIWANNGGTSDQVMFSKNNVIINVSSKGIDDRALFDVYVSLKNLPDERLLVTISKKLTMQDLYNLVIEAFEMKYAYFKGLKGLRVKEMISPELNGYSSESFIKGNISKSS